ncbi:MAG: PAS domain S-box protein [Pseudomonadales bacterium]|nr:PAS domain S-box protein [Pseudomonadales bacterium]
MNDKVDELGRSHLSSIRERVWVSDIDSLELDLEGILKYDPIKYVSVTENGEDLVIVGVLPTENIIRHEYPITYSHEGKTFPIGLLTVVASSTDIYDRFVTGAVTLVSFFSFQIFLVAGLAFLVFNRNITRHLSAIAAFARKIELSNIDQTMELDRKKKDTPDELDILLDALTSMQHQLNSSVQSLKESEENLSLTLDCIGDAVIATDYEGSVARMNPIAEQLTAWSLQDALGRDIKEIFPIIDAITGLPVENPVDQALTTGKIVTLSNSTTLIAKDGEQYQIADSAAPIRNSVDEIIGGILVFHDVTAAYQMRKNLRETQKRLKLHIDQTPLGVIEWDSEFRVVDWNPAAEKIFGYSKKEVLGKRHKDLLVPSSAVDGVEGRWNSFIDHLTADKFVSENITKNGDPLRCEWYSTPLLDEDGDMIGVASLVLDVTKRIETEQALAQNRSEQEMLLSYMLDAIISTDSQGVIESFNASAEKMFGYKASDAIGEELRIILPEETLPLYNNLIRQPLSRQTDGTLARVYEVLAVKKNGQKFPMRFSIGVPPRQGNSQQKFIFSIHDLTIEAQKEEQLRHSQKMDALGKLTGGIAHDYNNMLGIILGYTELLNMTLPPDSTAREYIDKIEQAGERGVALTKKMLSISRRQPIEASAVNINLVLKQQQQMLQKTLTARVTVNMKLASDLWYVWIDEGDFSDVIINLSINAMHAIDSVGTLIFETMNHGFSSGEGLPANLAAGDYVLLRVIDTGKGMDKETIEKIFDPFFTTKGDKGSGLGLSQVYGFMERSKGAVRVESEVTKGTCFTLYFPRYLQEVKKAKPELSKSNTALKGEGEAILVIDDEIELLSIASEILSGNGYSVYTAQSGASALEALAKHHVDLIVSDVVMPEMDGYELASHIKNKYPAIPVQLVSGYNEAVDADYFDESLHDQLIRKPYSSDILLERIREILD